MVVEHSTGQASTDSVRAGASSAPVRLLVVDDNADNRDLLARRLARVGYSVSTAEDGWRALDLLKAKRFDLIVLDIMMPGIQGIEVLERIRERFSKLELPVLIATAKLDSDEVVRALALGANDYVTKPLDFPVVKARIESQLQTREQINSMAPPPAQFLADGTALPGTILDGKYEVLSTLGSGGFAVVFKARQLSTKQIIALKVMRPHRLTGGEAAQVELARFERELELIGKLKHPHIVELVDSGALAAELPRIPPRVLGSSEDPNTGSLGEPDSIQIETFPLAKGESPYPPSRQHRVPYIAMEYLDGKPLSVIVADEAPMSVDRVVELALPVVSAIAAAHTAGVVHRDLKPPNILVTHVNGRPHPKVLDFGIAKLMGDEVRQITTEERFLGTPEYMSPEQAQGEPELDGRCDQYTMGVILYEALTGQRPFRSSSFMRLMHAIMRGDCIPPRELQPSIPEELEAIIMRAMHPDRGMRFTSMRGFGRALLKFAAPHVEAQWTPALSGHSDPPPRSSSRPGDGSDIDIDVPDTLERPVEQVVAPQATTDSGQTDDRVIGAPQSKALVIGVLLGAAAGLALGWFLF